MNEKQMDYYLFTSILLYYVDENEDMEKKTTHDHPKNILTVNSCFEPLFGYKF
jgi:hypothetical protein